MLLQLACGNFYRIRYAYMHNIKYSKTGISQDIRIFNIIQGYRETRAFLIEHESHGGQECIARGGGHLVRSFRAGQRIQGVSNVTHTFSRPSGRLKAKLSRMSIASMSRYLLAGNEAFKARRSNRNFDPRNYFDENLKEPGLQSYLRFDDNILHKLQLTLRT